MKPNREPRPATSVMADVWRLIPAVAKACYIDRSWIWYCGPSLQGEANRATRETLSLLGFRFAPKGHVMQDGVTRGSWSHSCDKPLRRIFKKGVGGNNLQSDEQAEASVESILAGCDL